MQSAFCNPPGVAFPALGQVRAGLTSACRKYQQLEQELASRQTTVDASRCGEAACSFDGAGGGQDAEARTLAQQLQSLAAQGCGKPVSPQVDKATFTWLRSHVIRHIATCASEIQVDSVHLCANCGRWQACACELADEQS